MKKSLFLIAFACATLFSVKFYAQDYQGEVDFGYSLGVGKLPSDRFNVSTVHGFEIEDYLFLGVGAGLDYHFVEENIYADCADNQLTSLDVSSNPDLWILECHDNQLTSLDISNNKSLAYLRCYDNPGDGTKFNVAAWFSNNSIPSSYYQEFTTGTWSYNGNTISINYYIPE